MASLADVCNVDLLSLGLIECGASIGLKLLRSGVLRGRSDADVCRAAAVAAAPPAASGATSTRGASAEVDRCEAALHLHGMARDAPDDVLVRLLPWASPASLLCAAAGKNFRATCLMLLELGADLRHVEVRRGRRRGLVDMAARVAGLDGDWRLVLEFLRRGAKPETAQGILFSPLRRGDVGLARELLRSGVRPGAPGLASLLCDVCGHGATESAELLIRDVLVPINTRNERDGDTCTDRALAWHCWDTAEWLVGSMGGVPSKPKVALGHLMDAAGDPAAARVLSALRARDVVSLDDLLAAAVQRGDLLLCEELLRGEFSAHAAQTRLSRGEPPIVDVALCHGHLRVAQALMRHGFRAQDVAQARADVRLHNHVCHKVAEEVFAMLPESPLDERDTSASD